VGDDQADDSSASIVALVQTALMLPLMLVAVPAGAVADMFDRRQASPCSGLSFSVDLRLCC
jgi:MFS family permease